VTEVDTNGRAPEGVSPDQAAAAGQNSVDAPGEETNADDTDAREGEDNDSDQDAVGRGEAKQRRRAQKAERERDELADALARTRQSIVDKAVSAAHLDPRLLTAAGHTVDTLVGDDGLIDHDALAEAITTTKREFRVANGLQPNPQQGHVGGQGRSPASWSKALKSG
jgi:hypothetical protein